MHALAVDRAVSGLNRDPGRDKGWILRSERPRTRVVGCEVVYVVDAVSPDQQEGENADADAEADG